MHILLFDNAVFRGLFIQSQGWETGSIPDEHQHCQQSTLMAGTQRENHTVCPNTGPVISVGLLVNFRPTPSPCREAYGQAVQVLQLECVSLHKSHNSIFLKLDFGIHSAETPLETYDIAYLTK